MTHKFAQTVLMALALMHLGDAGAADVRHAWSDPWRISESAAFDAARSSGRHVLVVFGAQWCVPCRKVEQIMRDEVVLDVISERFVPLHFDITDLSEHDEALQAKYRALTLPAVIFVNGEGKELGRWDLETAETFIATARRIAGS